MVETKKQETKMEDNKEEKTVEVKTEDTKKTEKKTVVKKEEKKIKEFAEANGYSIGISTKHSVAICRMLTNKSLERASEMLELVLKKKLAVPMVGSEIPHRKRSLIPHTAGGSGRFPMNATKEFIGLVKQLKANCDVNGVENPVITKAMANLASRPFRRDGKRGKRTHIHLEARDRTKLVKKKK